MNGIEKMTVDKAKLLETVKKNLDKHNELYKIAVNSYWKAAEVKLVKMLDRVRAKRKIEHYLDLVLPTNHEDDYKLIISMLEFSEDKKIMLTPAEFSKYVMNDWSWKQEFKSTAFINYAGVSGSSGYSGRVSPNISTNITDESCYINDDTSEPLDEEILKKIDEF